MMQIDMFDSERIAEIQKDFDKLNTIMTKSRKSLFAKNSWLEKQLYEISEQLKSQDMELYRLKQHVYGESKIEQMQKVM